MFLHYYNINLNRMLHNVNFLFQSNPIIESLFITTYTYKFVNCFQKLHQVNLITNTQLYEFKKDFFSPLILNTHSAF